MKNLRQVYLVAPHHGWPGQSRARQSEPRSLKREVVYAVSQRSDTCGHRAIWIAERVYDSKMVGAGDSLVTSERHVLSPGFDDRFALAQELARFQRAHDRIEASPGGHAPIKR